MRISLKPITVALRDVRGMWERIGMEFVIHRRTNAQNMFKKRRSTWESLPAPAKEFVSRVIKEVNPTAIYYLGENKGFLYEEWEDAVYEFIVVVEDGNDWEKGIQVYEIQKEIDKKYSIPLEDTWVVAAITVEESDFYYNRGRAAEIFAGFAMRYGILVYQRKRNQLEKAQVGTVGKQLSTSFRRWVQAANCWLKAAEIQLNDCPLEASSSVFMSVELLLKGILVSTGYDEERLKKLRHNIKAIMAEIRKHNLAALNNPAIKDKLQRAVELTKVFSLENRYPYKQTIEISLLREAIDVVRYLITYFEQTGLSV